MSTSKECKEIVKQVGLLLKTCYDIEGKKAIRGLMNAANNRKNK